jgi:hypothetical protein
MTTWSVEASPRGDGIWFVAEDPHFVHAFAGPGVWLPSPAAAEPADMRGPGWRRASWPSEPEPTLDFEAPCQLEPVRTRDVCAPMPPAMRRQVPQLMVDQLQAALCLGRGSDGLVDDEVARAGAAAAKWAIDELRAACPDEAWRLPASVVELSDIPPISDEFLAVLPKARGADQPNENAPAVERDGRDWLRQLAAAVLRWVAEAFTRLADWLVGKAPVAGSKENRPEEEAREEELVG